MTDQEIRIAIAEAIGWEIYWNERTTKQWICKNPQGKIIACDEEPITETRIAKASFAHLLPDYPNDLNAMHDAEKFLTEDQQEYYIMHLLDGASESVCDLSPRDADWTMATSPARQRAEAFLRTIGKWKEETK